MWFVLTQLPNYTQFAIKQESSATFKIKINIEMFRQVMLEIFL